MSERAPYSRVYWTVRSDPRLEDIYADDHHWAAWNRLLLAADMAWPAPADLPGSARKASVTALFAAGVIELLPGGLFRFHGLDTERGRRRDAAANRLPPKRYPDGDQTVPSPVPLAPSRAPSSARLGSSSLGSESPAPEREAEPTGDKEPDPADAYWSLTGKYPTDKPLAWIDDLTRTYGAMAVIRAVADAHQTDKTAATLLGRAQDRLRRDARTLDLKAQVAAQTAITERRAAPRPVVDEVERMRILKELIGGPA